jgi:uncharacterized protein YqeY
MKTRVKKDMMTAMKEKNVVARDILRVLKGEIERNEQSKDGKVDLSDSEVIKIIKKLIENSTPEEAEVLETYVPKQMTTDEVSEQAASYITREGIDSPREMGKVMGYFKQNFEGLYDGRELSGIVKTLLL